ncbi:MAG: hypothetical protein C4329_10565 [Chitinophagaceae bacterium]
MNVCEFKKALQSKRIELGVAIELGKPQTELKKLYQNLKELNYQIAMQEAQLTQIAKEAVSL